MKSLFVSEMNHNFTPLAISITPSLPHQLLSLSRRSAYWPFVKFDILFDQQDSSIDLWSISCIFGFVPQHATARKSSQLRTAATKTRSSDLDPPSKIRLKPLLLSVPRSLSDSVLSPSSTGCITQTPKSTRSVELARNRLWRATLVNFGNVRCGCEGRALIR